MKTRYKFYREHKYVSFALNDLERLVAKTDFRIAVQVDRVEKELAQVVEMLRGHAQYENEKLHTLLQKKGSAIFHDVQEDHECHEAAFASLQDLLNQIKASTDPLARVELGYQFYLNYRKFVGENLLHLHEEETQILPELQRLYSDAELGTVERETYQIMTVDQLVNMVQVLFPHFNPSDREAFLIDIQDAAPEKFNEVEKAVQTIIEPSGMDIGGVRVRILTQTPQLELFEMTMDEAERGPGLHFHRQMTEMFYILSGNVQFTIGEREFIAGPLEFHMVAPNIVHQWKSRGPVQMLTQFSPSKNQTEYFKMLAQFHRENVGWKDAIANLAHEFDNIGIG